MRINQRWFVWIILTLCVLAIPVAVLTQSLASTPAAKDASGSGLMTKFKRPHSSGQVVGHDHR
ncbi:MAG: hypothetical protein HC888_12500 [Candidatus Competibacteraceae bacterium]|nr:hypothetical protein [Candidatus Competibacteraceae bacterium]